MSIYTQILTNFLNVFDKILGGVLQPCMVTSCSFPAPHSLTTSISRPIIYSQRASRLLLLCHMLHAKEKTSMHGNLSQVAKRGGDWHIFRTSKWLHNFSYMQLILEIISFTQSKIDFEYILDSIRLGQWSKFDYKFNYSKLWELNLLRELENLNVISWPTN
jgi:hypothetical protein